MKKNLFSLVVLCFVLAASGPLYPSGVDTLSHQSAEIFLDGLSPNASSDSADCMNYNPAGTAFMNDGLYMNLGVQCILSTYQNTYEKIRRTDNEPIVLPNIYIVRKKDNWAVFGSFNIPGGTGQINYPHGIGYIKNQLEQLSLELNALTGGVSPLPVVSQSLKAGNGVFGLKFGGAYRFNDVVSVAIKGIYYSAYKNASVKYNAFIPYNLGTPALLAITSTVDYNATGNGIGCGAGIDVRPVKNLTLAATFISPGYIKYNYSHFTNRSLGVDTISGPNSMQARGIPALVTLQLWSHGNAEKNNDEYVAPAIVLTGLEYRATEKFWVSTSWAVYINSLAKWNGLEHTFNTGWEGSLGFRYNVTADIMLGIGVAYVSSGITYKSLEMISQASNPALNNCSVAGGVKFRAAEGLHLTVSADWTYYTPMKASYGLIEYRRMGYVVAFGAEYKIL
jgi:long-chain fatty acid transport protein